MKIVICGSRQSEEIKILRESVLKVELERQPASLELVDEEEEKKNPQKNAFVYFCDDEPTSQNAYEENKQQEIFKRIDEADWVIVVAPLNNIGKITYDEICEAREAQKRHPGYPVLTVFKCKDYYEYDENKTAEKGYGITDFGSNISIERLENELGTYLAEYEYDSKKRLLDSNKLGERIYNQLLLNIKYKKFRSQHILFNSVLGKDVKPKELYADPVRADFTTNEYLTRGSVDWNFGNMLLNENRKYIIITGIPGSGKSRAVMEALKPCPVENTEGYSLGVLSEERVVVVKDSNVNEVYRLLDREVAFAKKIKDYSNDNQKSIYLLIDQVRDVFNMMNDEDVKQFFVLLEQIPYIKLIATSLEDAYEDLCGRWGNAKSPLINAATIDIPLISKEKESDQERIRSFFSDYPNAETIGECIPELARYKEGIVDDIYQVCCKRKSNKSLHRYIPCLLKSLQTADTFRRGDMALFLPIMIAKTLLDEDYNKEQMIDAVQYLIVHHVIKVTDIKSNEVIKRFNTDCFISRMCDSDEYVFDGEKYEKPIVSTRFRYAFNEIIWHHLNDVENEKTDSDRLLWNFDLPQSILRSAKSFFISVPKARTLKRILPRIPKPPRISPECNKNATETLRNYAFDELSRMNPAEDKDYINAVAQLIRYSTTIDQIHQIFTLLKKNNVKPTDTCIAYLYLAGSVHPNLANEVEKIYQQLKSDYKLDGYSAFSFSRKVVFLGYDLTLSENLKSKPTSILRLLQNKNFKFYLEDGAGPYYGFLNYVAECKKNNYENDLYKIGESLVAFAGKINSINDVELFLELYRQCCLSLSRRVLKILINKLADFEWSKIDDFLPPLGKNVNLISEIDKEFTFVSVMRNCDNFLKAKVVYDAYYVCFNKDHPKLLSMAMQSVQDNEFQIALKFLDKVEARRKDNNEEKLSVIVYNNLLKRSPALDEAFALLSRLDSRKDLFQIQTLASILTVIKKRKKRIKENMDSGSKLFFLVYDVIMRLSNSAHHGNIKGLWQSQYILSILMSFAQTKKHEDFIRNKILEGLDDTKKCMIFDYSTGLASIRIRKLYRNMDEAWKVFNQCRCYRNINNLSINSELYNCMMSRIAWEQGEKTNDYWDKLRKIVLEDEKRVTVIRKDDHFYPNWYCYDPVKRNELFDEDGEVSIQFVNDINSVPVREIKVFNKLLLALMRQSRTNDFQFDFNHCWTLYQFIIYYYDKRMRDDRLRPNRDTFRWLFNAVQTESDFKKVENEAKTSLKDYLKIDSFRDAYLKAASRANVKRQVSTHNEQNDYMVCIKNVQNAIDTYEEITPTLLNNELIKISRIVRQEPSQSSSTPQEILMKLKCELLECKEYGSKLPINVGSCISIIKIADEAESIDDVKKWIEALKRKPEVQYKYNADYCRELANMQSIAKNDLQLSRIGFKNWKQIMNDIGNIPKNHEQDMVNVSSWGKKETDYWHVFKRYLWNKMTYYYDHCTDQEMNDQEKNELLQEICDLMEEFNKNSIRVPKHDNDDIDIFVNAQILDVFDKVYK